MIHVSSVAAIGFRDDPHNPVDETMNFDERKYRNRIYMFSKHLGEREALGFREKGLDVVVANPGLLYGPGEKGPVLILFRNISTGRLKLYPTGGTGIVDVRDAARGILSAFLKGRAGERYILNGYNISFREATAIISRALGREPLSKPVPKISRIPLGIFLALTERFRKKHPDLTAESFEFCFRFRYYSSAKAGKELGWRPEIPFEETIADSVKWYRRTGLL
jgi:dihydroflavonol-4-reductase